LSFTPHGADTAKKLEPIYKKLGKHYSDQTDIIIAKFDAIANDVPNEEFKVSGFPTIYYVTKSNQVVKYEGADRDFNGFKTFLDEKRKNTDESVDAKDEL